MERRESQRVKINIPVLISYDIHGLEIDDTGYLIDLSNGGIALYTNQPLFSDQNLNLQLGAAFKELKNPLEFSVLHCNSCTSRAYPYKIRARLNEQKKEPTLAYKGLVSKLRQQAS